MWGKPLKFSIMSSDVDQFMYLSVLANHLVLLHVNVHGSSNSHLQRLRVYLECLHRRGVRDDCGPVHIVIGDGGNREGLADSYDEPQPEWSAFREASYGSGTLDLLNTTHALWRWHRNQDSEAIVSDEVGPQLHKVGIYMCSQHYRTNKLQLCTP